MDDGPLRVDGGRTDLRLQHPHRDDRLGRTVDDCERGHAQSLRQDQPVRCDGDHAGIAHHVLCAGAGRRQIQLAGLHHERSPAAHHRQSQRQRVDEQPLLAQIQRIVRRAYGHGRGRRQISAPRGDHRITFADALQHAPRVDRNDASSRRLVSQIASQQRYALLVLKIAADDQFQGLADRQLRLPVDDLDRQQGRVGHVEGDIDDRGRVESVVGLDREPSLARETRFRHEQNRTTISAQRSRAVLGVHDLVEHRVAIGIQDESRQRDRYR